MQPENQNYQPITIAPTQAIVTTETKIISQVITTAPIQQEVPPQEEPKVIAPPKKEAIPKKVQAMPKEEVTANNKEDNSDSDQEEESKVVADTKTKLILPPKPVEDGGIKALQSFIDKFVNPLTTLEEKIQMVMKYSAD